MHFGIDLVIYYHQYHIEATDLPKFVHGGINCVPAGLS